MVDSMVDVQMTRQEIARSNVRIRITYLFSVAYILVVAWFLYVALGTGTEPDTQMAIGMISGLGSAALGVVGFWFGGRKAATDMLATAQASIAAISKTPIKRVPAPTSQAVPPPGTRTSAIGAKPLPKPNTHAMKPPSLR